MKLQCIKLICAVLFRLSRSLPQVIFHIYSILLFLLCLRRKCRKDSRWVTPAASSVLYFERTTRWSDWEDEILHQGASVCVYMHHIKVQLAHKAFVILPLLGGCYKIRMSVLRVFIIEAGCFLRSLSICPITKFPRFGWPERQNWAAELSGSGPWARPF